MLTKEKAMSMQNETSCMSPAAATCVRQGLGETESALRYRSIIDAVRLIGKTRRQLHDEEDLGFTLSPAWRLLNSAEAYLLKQANGVLRGEEL
jgi:hypothetical protein